MLFKRYESRGLAHYSYLIGDGNQAVVIDPRRDCDVYIEAAAREGMRISHILETHRHEDYVVGSVELASRTKAVILRSAYSELEYGYGEEIEDDEVVRIGQYGLSALHTPGHTLGHMSYLLGDPGDSPWIVFTGDALFAGDVGRTDFYGPKKLPEMTGKLYDSLFERLLRLGDGVIVCPAHGAGSACGTAIADRKWTTIGLERKLNAKLRHTNRDDFIENVGRLLEYPPYFRTMEKLNLEGARLLGSFPVVPPLGAKEFADRMDDAIVLDTRLDLGFTSAHVPGALSVWDEGLSGFAGWFLTYDKPILLVTETSDVSRTVLYLLRLGFDRVEGFLAGGMLGWHTAGLESEHTNTVVVQELCHILDADGDAWILDVRSAEEVAKRQIPGARNIHITELPQRMGEVPRDRQVHVFCGSGLRATIAASILSQAGWDNHTVVLGGLAGWSSVTCELE